MKRFGEEPGKLLDNWKTAFDLRKFPHNLDPWRVHLRKRWLTTLTFAMMILGNAGVLFGMGAWAYIEKQALTPVYSRLRCENPQLLVPLSMSGPNGLVGKVNTSIQCYNPNLFDALTTNDPKPALSYAVRPIPGKPDIYLGNITYVDSKFTAKENSTLTLLIDMNVPVDPASKITMDAGLPPKFAVLLLMVLNTEVTANAKFMFVAKPEHHLLPTKYCGFYAGILKKDGVVGLGPKSETRCTNSRNETMTLMENITIAEPAKGSILQVGARARAHLHAQTRHAHTRTVARPDRGEAEVFRETHLLLVGGLDGHQLRHWHRQRAVGVPVVLPPLAVRPRKSPVH